jgi:hypothetical protein
MTFFESRDVEANAAIQRFCYETMRPYGPPERRHVDDGYRSLPFPFAEIEAPQFIMEAKWGIEDLPNQLHAFHAGKGVHKEMDYMARKLMEEEMEAIAAYFASLPPR